MSIGLEASTAVEIPRGLRVLRGVVSCALVLTAGCAQPRLARYAPVALTGHTEMTPAGTGDRGTQSNVDVQPILVDPLRRAITCSPTVQQQLLRIGDAPSFLLAIRIVDGAHLGGARARTSIRREGTRVVGRVAVPPDLRLFVELIAHELEHIVEYLDGVHVVDARGPGRVLQDDGDVETDRARRAGLIAADECRAHRRVVR